MTWAQKGEVLSMYNDILVRVLKVIFLFKEPVYKRYLQDINPYFIFIY